MKGRESRNTKENSTDNYVVTGKIQLSDKTPLSGFRVEAYEQTLNDTKFLDRDISSEAGKYKIQFSRTQCLAPKGLEPHLRIRVFEGEGKHEILLAESLVYNAQREEKVDIVIISDKYRPPSEYERLTSDIAPHLGKASLSELTFENIEFLAGASGRDKIHIALMIQAAKLSEESGIAVEVFYAFGRKDLPLYLPSLLIQEPRWLRGTLQTAIRENVIPAEFKAQIDPVLEKLGDILVEKAFEEPEQEGTTPFGALVRTAVSSPDKQKAFLKRFVDHKGSMKKLWEELAEELEFAEEVDDLKFAVETGALTGNHLPLVKELQRRQRNGEFSNAKDLTKLDRPHWLAIINQSVGGEVIGVPPHIVGEDREERVGKYVRALTASIEAAYPTAFILHRIEQSNGEGVPAKTDLITFFGNNPDFEFGRVYLPKYLSEQRQVRLSGINDRKKLTEELLAWDRLYRLAPRFSQMQRLKEAGFDAAHQITGLSKGHFFTLMRESTSDLPTEEHLSLYQLNQFYDNARIVQSEVTSYVGLLNGALNQPRMWVLPWYKNLQDYSQLLADDNEDGVANWETLFGSMGLCGCEHCKSIHGPAAYLVDILTFLKARPAADGRTAKDVLFDRRPDIGRIALTCQNTNTPLPYVDLVNEILEEAVYLENPDADLDPPVPQEDRQTFGTAEELEANPEHLCDSAYTVLARAFFPWSLPFDLGIEAGRAYLEHLGVHRYELMETFRNPTEQDQSSIFAIACEYLGLTPVDGLIFIGEDDADRWKALCFDPDEVPEDWEVPNDWEYWGLRENDTFTNPRDTNQTVSGSWIGILSHGTALVHQSGLNYEEIREIADTQLLRREGVLQFQFTDPDDPDRETCDLWHLNINGLTDLHLNGLHRFICLWRKLGWTVVELDKAIIWIGESGPDDGDLLDENTLIGIWRIQQVRTALKLSVVEVLSFWFDIDRTGDDSLYSRLFLNKAVLNPSDEAFVAPDEDESLTDHESTILAALSISAEELATVRSYTGLADLEESLTVGNLSILYRHALLARSLKLPITEFFILKELCGIDPFDPNNQSGTIEFIETAQKVRSSGFSISDLDYLMRHQSSETAGVVPTESKIGAVIAEIRNGLKKIAAEHVSEPDPMGELVKGCLTELGWKPDDIDEVISTFDDSKVWSSPLSVLPGNITTALLEETNAKISFNQDAGELRFRGVMSLSEHDQLNSLATGDTNFTAAVRNLYNAPALFIVQNMKAFEVPPFYTVSLSPDALPEGIVFPDDLKAKIYYDTTLQALRFAGIMTETEHQSLLSLDPDGNYQEYIAAVNELFNDPDTPSEENSFLTAADLSDLLSQDNEITLPDARFGYLLDKLLCHLRDTRSESLIIQVLTESLGLESDVVKPLIKDWLLHPEEPSRIALDVFLDLKDTERANDALPIVRAEEDFQAAFDAYTLLDKIAQIANGLHLTSTELRWIFHENAPSTWLDLGSLPLAETGTARFLEWEKLVDFASLRDSLPVDSTGLLDLLDTIARSDVTEANFLETLSSRIGWDLDDLRTLAGLLGYVYPDDYQDGAALSHLDICFGILRRLGTPAREVAKWGEPMLSTTESAKIRQAAKAKYDNDQWQKIAKPLRDTLRERQRASLVDYLVARKGLADASDLYDHYLIDVEMAPCMITSRIKQAISSVQLFIQKCFMNREELVDTSFYDEDEWREWAWMKHYRVWEAGVRVFLNPENWIEAELLTNKSPFLRELESELLQSEVTDKAAQTALSHYLEKLDAVARLDICGIYHQKEVDDNGSVDVVHVFGRTQNTPHLYYYRRRIDSSYWTSWEKVELDIEGDHLIPVVWNERLYLFWPVFTEDAFESHSEGEDGSMSPVEKYWKIELAWSELKSGKWLPKSLSREFIAAPRIVASIAEVLSWGNLTDNYFKEYAFASRNYTTNNFSFSPYFDHGGSLIIRCFIRNYTFVRGDSPMDKFNPHFIRGEYDCFDLGYFEFKGQRERVITFPQDHPADLFTSNGDYRAGIVTHTGSHVEGQRIIENIANVGHDYFLVDDIFRPTELLKKTPTRYRAVTHSPAFNLITHRPFVFSDQNQQFFIAPLEVSTEEPSLFVYPPVGVEEPPEQPPERQPEQPPALGAPPGVEWPLSSHGWPYSYLGYGHRSPVSPPYTRPWVLTGLMGSFDEAHTSPFLYEMSPSGRTMLPFSRDTRNWNIWLPEGRSEHSETTVYIPREGLWFDDTAFEGRSNGDERAYGIFADTGLSHVPSQCPTETKYQFQTFWHPLVDEFIRRINRDGIDGLMDRDLQGLSSPEFDFDGDYVPTPLVHDSANREETYPKNNVDFTTSGAYSQYNWELFFHTPLLIATSLSRNQRFEEAQKWFHYIFNPLDTSNGPKPSKYWQTQPFFEVAEEGYLEQQINRLMRRMTERSNDPELEAQLAAWRANPFDPHAIARLRITAYQQTVVMKYLDNLIAWGDQLFHRDTIESLNEATQLYVLAAKILGPRPSEITKDSVSTEGMMTYDEIEGALDSYLSMIESAATYSPNRCRTVSRIDRDPLPRLVTMGFCIPKNDKLLAYWDTIEDRLFKIRHCQNIEGVYRQLPLFAPPIDPGLLVRAAAAGIDITSVLNDMNAPLPYYRFQTVVQKALDLCNDVKALGASLLSVLEKRDAEQLALVRAEQEIEILDLVEAVKQAQLEEAEQQKVVLKKSRDQAVTRYQYYQKLLGNDTDIPEEGAEVPDYQPTANYSTVEAEGVKMVAEEKEEMENLEKANYWQWTAAQIQTFASIASLIPQLEISAKPMCVGTAGIFGGAQISAALSAHASTAQAIGSQMGYQASKAAKKGVLVLRELEWGFQSDSAGKEIMQIDQQLIAADMRIELARKELENHRAQMKNARDIEEFMREKYTNAELYNWMVGETSGVYFQAYQLAYDMAKRAERAYRFEFAKENSNFIKFGYWDSLKKGLMAGDKLHQDLRRIEIAYLAQNKREYELTKHISLALLHPEALVNLRETGECFFDLPEAIFDLDHPGHYMRRIKSVTVTIPCITGPYTSVSGTLTLQSNSIRKNTNLVAATDSTYASAGEGDDRFINRIVGVQSIATSKGQADSGLFELNFRDERYLPFEGAGVISRWRFQLPKQFRQFDYSTISDIVINVHYTARDGGAAFRGVVENELQESLNTMLLETGRAGLYRLFSAKEDFPNEWHRFLHSELGSAEQEMRIPLNLERFPYLFKNKGIRIKNIKIFLKLKSRLDDADNPPLTLTLLPVIATLDPLDTPLTEIPSSWDTNKTLECGAESDLGGSPQATWAYDTGSDVILTELTEWTIAACSPEEASNECILIKEETVEGQTIKRLDADKIEDMGIICHYSIQ